MLTASTGRHGKVKASGTSFVFEDGTRFLPVGTTVYAMVHQTRDLLEETLRSLAASPFNKVRFCLFPKYFFYNREEPQQFPFVRGGRTGALTSPCRMRPSGAGWRRRSSAFWIMASMRISSGSTPMITGALPR